MPSILYVTVRGKTRSLKPYIVLFIKKAAVDVVTENTECNFFSSRFCHANLLQRDLCERENVLL